MYTTRLKSKIHRCTVTGSDLNYEGSIGIDESLMELAEIAEYERVDVWNVTNGERFYTYAIPIGDNKIIVNGAAARKVAAGDILIIASWVHVDEYEDYASHYPKLVFVDRDNELESIQ